MSDQSSEAVLLTGAYGTGKSSVAAEMAELLEARDVPYAAIDLDWLIWANVADCARRGRPSAHARRTWRR